MSPHPSIPESLWNTVPPEAQAAILAVIASLEKRIADLEARLNQNSTNSSKPPSTDPPAVKVKRRPPAPPSGRKRGGQPGHKRHTRALVPPEQLRETFEVKPTQCRGCGAALQGDDPDPLRHQVAEIPPVRPDVDEYRLHRLTCSCCGTATRAELPAGVPTGPFGPRLRAILTMFAGSYRLAKRPIQQLASDLFGLDISLGMIPKLERRAAEVLEPVVAEVAAAIVAAPSAHIDETSWSEANEKAWLWVGQTDDLTAFTIADNRGADVARSILGTDKAKVVISDRFPSYDWIEQHQYCWSHLRRDFQAMIDRQDEGSAVGLGVARVLGPAVPLVAQVPRRGDGLEHVPGLRPADPVGRPAGPGPGCVVRQREDGGDVPDVAGGRGAPVDLPPGAGDRADEQRGRAGVASRRVVAEDRAAGRRASGAAGSSSGS